MDDHELFDGWKQLAGHTWKKSFQFSTCSDAQDFSLEILSLGHPQAIYLCISEVNRASHLMEVSIHACSWNERDVAGLVRSIELSYQDHNHANKFRQHTHSPRTSVWSWSKFASQQRG
jgi:hypothetical protein